MSIDRYTLHPMDAVWSDDSKFEFWRGVEIANAVAKGAPDEIVEELHSSPPIQSMLVHEEEKRTRHDVMAFLNVWRGVLSEDAGSWVHKGLTSSDVVDTANGIRLGLACDTIGQALDKFIYSMSKHALVHWRTHRVGRTHGQHADPTTWGYRIADFVAASARSADVLRAASSQVRVMKLSGPVGNYLYTTFKQECEAARILDLEPASVATQVVMRDRLSDYMYALARIASVVEAFALEVRLSAQSDVGEVSEGFRDGQMGSSAMPHKKNPITAEQLTGLAKIVRAQLVPVMEGVALWYERDISHSSVERIAVETASKVAHYMLVKATELVSDLVVHEEIMSANLDAARDATLSMWAKEFLIEHGMPPVKAWRMVHEASSQPHPDLVGKVNRLLAQARIEDIRLPYQHPGLTPKSDTGHVKRQLERLVDVAEGRTMSIFLVTDPSDLSKAHDLTRFFRNIDIDGNN